MLHMLRMTKRRLMRRYDGPRILRDRYRDLHGGTLDDSKTFTQKLYRRMIDEHARPTALFAQLADKYLARTYVADRIGKKHLIPLLWTGGDPTRIPFDQLPNRSIALTNHGSGLNAVLRKPIDRQATIAKLRESLAINYYWAFREAWYYPIKPRVMIEEFLDDGYADGPLDYRFWCFHGKVEAIQVDNHSHTLNPFYSPSWDSLGATYRRKEDLKEVIRPSNLDEMLKIATTLSKPFDFVRIDLYSVRAHTYFGEFTFSPTAGTNKFEPPEWDRYFGDLWTLEAH